MHSHHLPWTVFDGAGAWVILIQVMADFWYKPKLRHDVDFHLWKAEGRVQKGSICAYLLVRYVNYTGLSTTCTASQGLCCLLYFFTFLKQNKTWTPGTPSLSASEALELTPKPGPCKNAGSLSETSLKACLLPGWHLRVAFRSFKVEPSLYSQPNASKNIILEKSGGECWLSRENMGQPCLPPGSYKINTLEKRALATSPHSGCSLALPLLSVC